MDYLNKSNADDISDSQIKEFYEAVYRIETADYVAAQTIKKLLGNIEGYKSGDDKTLNSIIDNYLQSLNNDTTTDINTIIAKVEELVTAYADTAQTNSKTRAITDFGYDTEGLLNDLQKQVLTNDITKKITDHVSANNTDYKEYQSVADSAIKNYVAAYLSDKKAADFVSLSQFDINTLDEYSYRDVKTIYKKFKEISKK